MPPPISPKLSQTQWFDYALLGLLAILWSSSFVFIKIGVATLPPATLTAGRLALGALILFVFSQYRGHQIPFNLKAWRLFFFVGFFGNALPFTLIGWGEQFVDSGLAALFMGIMPVMTAVLAHFWVEDEPLTPHRVGGVVLGFSGLIFLIGIDALSGLGDTVIAQIAIVCGPVSYAVTTIYSRRNAHLPLPVLGAGTLTAGAIIILPLSLMLDRPWTLEPSLESLGAMVVLGLFPTALASLIFFRLIHKIGANGIAQNNYLVPLLGVGWGMLLLNERPGWNVFVALVLILSGVVLVNRQRSKA